MQNIEENWIQWHGFKGDESWSLPKLVAKSDQANRADQNNMIKANEYLDSPEVLDAKLQIVADCIKKSKNCITYTGAGLSRASGIPDYATKSAESIVKGPKIQNSIDAQPTYAHHVLVALNRAGYLKHWVQQNHDGLPQKAGYPQEHINEIHGAWFDPSNPVVQFSGNLRSDLFQWMMEWEERADMCLCLGTSLSGMNADRMAKTPAKKSLQNKAIGTVIINLQQTPLDSRCFIRIWAKLDDAFKILAEKLNIKVDLNKPTVPDGDVYYVPYGENGVKDEYRSMKLDLRIGSKIRIPVAEAMNANAEGTVVGKRNGHYVVELKEYHISTARRMLGSWWVDCALRGVIQQLPVVNVNPKVEKLKNKFNYQTTQSQVEEEKVSEKRKKQESVEEKTPSTLNIIQSHFITSGQTANVHQWGLRLQPGAEEIVSEVVYELHPTFSQRVITCTSAPFNIDLIGWGTFTVRVTITLKNGKKIEAAHELSFDQIGEDVKRTPVSLL